MVAAFRRARASVSIEPADRNADQVLAPHNTDDELVSVALRLTWCVFPVSLLSAVMAHLIAGRALDTRAWTYLTACVASGAAVLAAAHNAKRAASAAALNLWVAMIVLNLGLYAAHPNIFGADNTVSGAAVQVNSTLIAMILQSMLLCGVLRASYAVVGVYLVVGFVGPIMPEPPRWIRAAIVLLVAGALVFALRLMNQLLRRSLDLSKKNAELVAELRAANQQLAHAAERDALTGVLNRRGWMNATAHLDNPLDNPSTGEAGAHQLVSKLHATAGIVYVDIDGFKSINDTFGHAAGDEVLRNVADALSGALRPGDIVARIGGDEFAALFRSESHDEVTAVEDRLIVELQRHAENSSVRWSVSVGSAFVEEPGALQRAALHADSLLYRNKAVVRRQHA